MIDNWIQRKIGQADNEALTREAIEAYQLGALRRTVLHAKENSSYYAHTLAGVDSIRDIASLTDIAKLPMMGEAELIDHGPGLVCVPASGVSRIVTLPTSGTGRVDMLPSRNASRIDVLPAGGTSRIDVLPAGGTSRIVTLPTSGTTGEPKRIYFTEKDQELMIDYIANGLGVMTKPGDVWLILMPAERPGSVGDLVKIGLERIGCEVIAHGILPMDGRGDDAAIALMAARGVNAMLATASAAERLAGKSAGNRAVRNPITSILLSAEYVSEEARTFIESAWHCNVFEHYGMTEMGLGGAMACEARIGYHPREADLLFEIIDPDTGEPAPDGAYGEIVFTTLTREAMPFIRYRTGDYSRFIPGPCPCGSILKRLDRVADRKSVKGY